MSEVQCVVGDIRHYAISAYLRYLECGAGSSGVGDAGGLRLSTFSEWLGNVQGISGDVNVVDGNSTLVDFSKLLEADGSCRAEAWSDSGRGESTACVDAVDSGVVHSRVGSDVSACEVGDVGSVRSVKLVGPNGGLSKGRGPNYEKNQLRRVSKKEKKRGIKLGASCSPLEVISDKDVGSEKELSTSDKLKKSFDERRIAENELATQRARYNIRRNEYLQKSRVSEQKWETERLTSDEKLRKISEARLGASPGFAKTIVEEGLDSPSVPSLSDGTVSPNSSISVEEVQKMNATIEKLAGKVAELEMVNKKLVSFASSGIGSCSDGEDEDEEDPRDKGKPYLVLRGECVPRKGEYRFKTDQFRNGNKVMAIDGKIVELNWKGKPARYIGGVEDITMPSEKDPYENLVNYDGYVPPMF